MIQGNPDANEIAQMKKTILEKYDDNFDGKLDLEEVSSLSLCFGWLPRGGKSQMHDNVLFNDR